MSAKSSISINRALEVIEASLNYFRYEIESDRKNGIYTQERADKINDEIDASLQLLREKIYEC
tara:strand:- start:264 stop:452 length:189 start_codon:yes stop_codon:yes gene_type:complete